MEAFDPPPLKLHLYDPNIPKWSWIESPRHRPERPKCLWLEHPSPQPNILNVLISIRISGTADELTLKLLEVSDCYHHNPEYNHLLPDHLPPCPHPLLLPYPLPHPLLLPYHRPDIASPSTRPDMAPTSHPGNTL